jgi:hypothetical protein
VIPAQLLEQLNERDITLALSASGDQLAVRGNKSKLTSDLLDALRQHKQALIDILSSGQYQPRTPRPAAESDLPPLELSQAEREHIARTVGTDQIQDMYPLAPLQEGILFHHVMSEQGDPYLLPTLVSFDTRARLDAFMAALNAAIARHDILRTAVVWEALPEPIQVVLQHATLPLEEFVPEGASADVAAALKERFDPRHYRLDVRQAPLMRAAAAKDASNNRWLLQIVTHHLAMDHTTLATLLAEIHAIQSGEEASLPVPLPFRRFVAQARMGVSQAEHEAFFTEMLADVQEPTAPYGLTDVLGTGAGIDVARLELDPVLAARLREQARTRRLSAASLMHCAWAVVLARLSGRRDVVFGTVLFGRMNGVDGAGHAGTSNRHLAGRRSRPNAAHLERDGARLRPPGRRSPDDRPQGGADARASCSTVPGSRTNLCAAGGACQSACTLPARARSENGRPGGGACGALG